MKNKSLKIIGVIQLIISIISFTFPIFFLLLALLGLFAGGWGIVLFMYFGIIFLVLMAVLIPYVVSAISTIGYVNNGSNRKIPVVATIIGIFLYIILIPVVLTMNSSNEILDFIDYKESWGIILAIIIGVCYLLPLIINAFIMWSKMSKKAIRILLLSVIGVIFIILAYFIGKIVYTYIDTQNVKNGKKYSYKSFISQLKERRFLFEETDGTLYSLGYDEIIAGDKDEVITISKGDTSSKNYPFYIYKYHRSLINRTDPIYNDYYIGETDRYVDWYIYYVNGKIYAASKYVGHVDSKFDKIDYEVVLVEDDELTIYDREKNEYVNNKCLIDTVTVSDDKKYTTDYPTYGNKNDEKCRKEIKVDRIDELTLDTMAKETFKKTGVKITKD